MKLPRLAILCRPGKADSMRSLPLLLAGFVGNPRSEGGSAYLEYGAIFRPMFGGIVYDVAIVCELSGDVKFDWPLADSLGDFIEQVVWTFGSGV